MKVLHAIVLATSLAIATPACGVFNVKDPSSVIKDAAPAVFDNLAAALLVLDSLTAQYVRDMPPLPDVEDIETVKDIVLKLDDARQSLVELKTMIEKDDISITRMVPHVQVVVMSLDDVVKDLEKLGVSVPKSVKKSLDFVKKVVS